ncbi:hypothetical protein [Agrobacterium burrii]|uniref:Uncharacterized protein n=1 Tax=Agrobacterium burrii TaxID=2815339 RepID=A0ABS3EJV4_9HYPH|nr:hypothetical protein [Agrobacterium burrii]MBO0132276.1 hypothetical protein [Agrobacterium burrii]
MIELEIAVTVSDAQDALQRGAIVTVAQLADLDGERVASRQQRTQAVDIVSGEPEYRVFSFENRGIYEITIRSPSGTDAHELTVQQSLKLSFEVPSRRSATEFAAGMDWSRLIEPSSVLVPRPQFEGPPHYAAQALEDAIGGARVMNYLNVLATSEMVAPGYGSFADTKLLVPRLDVKADGIVQRFETPRYSHSTVIASPTFHELNELYFELRGLPTNGDPPIRWINSFGISGRDLVSIPWTWFPFPDDPERAVELKLSKKDARSGPMTALIVRDTKWGALLDFVTQGRMQDAALVADSLLEGHGSPRGGRSLPEYALEGKLQEPLVAALGGIILVSNIANLQRKRWDEWLENLANWFPNMPDAAAIFGYRCLQMGEIEKAHVWLTRSVSQGLPFFSATFRLLTLGFAQLEDRRSLDLISAAAAAVDVTQPFTVIHVPWGTTTRDPATTEGHG